MGIYDYLEKKQKLSEIIGIVLCFFAILLILSIYSFSPADPPNTIHGANYVYKNFMGILGANISYYIFSFFGKSSYLLPFIFIIWGVFEIKDKKIKEHTFIKISALLLVILGICSFLALPDSISTFNLSKYKNSDFIGKGGLLGFLVMMLIPFLGYGIHLLILSFFLLAIVLVTPLSFNQIMKIVWKGIEIAVLKTYDVLKKTFIAIINGTKFLSVKLYEYFVLLWKNTQVKMQTAVDNKKKEYDDLQKKKNLNKNEIAKKQIQQQNKRIEEQEKNSLNTTNYIYSPEEKAISSEKSYNSNDFDEFEDLEKQPEEKSIEQLIDEELEEREQMIKNNISSTSPVENKVEDNPYIENDDEFSEIENENSEYDYENDEDLEYEEESDENPFEEQIKETSHTNEKDVDNALNESNVAKKKEIAPFELPPIELLNRPTSSNYTLSEDEVRETIDKLEKTLESFRIDAKVVKYNVGPTVTMYEVLPGAGVAVSKIVNRADDIKLQLAAKSIRIVAPIPGKAAVGVEIPNKNPAMVTLRELLESDDFVSSKANLKMALGKDILGRSIVSNLAKMPHLLVAGATGSGKSVCINTMIISLIMKMTPDQLKLILVDPKMVELKVYKDLPHLISPVVTDMKKAARALQWAVDEMQERYTKLAAIGARDIIRYNAMVDEPERLPYLVIIVDELADLMALARKDVEQPISRLAAMARAVGIHVILATQRPSVDVVTGLIKANFPSRIACQVSSSIDSRTILNQVGAESLLGNGDMLYKPQSLPKPARVQGAYVSDEEIERILNFITSQRKFEPDDNAFIPLEAQTEQIDEDLEDELIPEAERIIVLSQQGSVALLQRKLKVGHNRAVRLMQLLENKGIVGPTLGPKPREIYVSIEEYLKKNNLDPESEQAKIF